MEKLQEDLLGEGIINSGVEKRTIYMKEQFLSSETYQKGFVLTNCQIYRKKTTDEEIDTTFNKIIKASNYNLHSTGISDKDQNRYTASLATDIIRIDENSFSEVVIRKALMAAENDFFRFENIKKHIVGLDSIDTLIKEYLPRFEIKSTRHFPACSHYFPKAGEARFHGRSRLFAFRGRSHVFPYSAASRCP